MDNLIKALAEKIWRYHHMDHSLSQADAILVLCSHDLIVAERGAQLFSEGWSPLLIYSGGLGAITSRLWTEPEADRFAAIAVQMGVPRDRIIIENRSTNTGENILFTRELLAQRNLHPQKMILVQKPYMERRTYATCKQMWPELDIVVTSPQTTFEEYLSDHSNREISADEVISIMVGDLQRIQVYPSKGYQIHQEIPDETWQAYEELVEAGYTAHLINKP